MSAKSLRAAFEKEWLHGFTHDSGIPWTNMDIDNGSNIAKMEFPMLYKVVSSRALIIAPAENWRYVKLFDGSDGAFDIDLSADELRGFARDLIKLADLLEG